MELGPKCLMHIAFQATDGSLDMIEHKQEEAIEHRARIPGDRHDRVSADSVMQESISMHIDL
jgi:hypothetical protein